MTKLYENDKQVTFFSADRYPTSNKEAEYMGLPGKYRSEMRAMTIAAFRVAQNSSVINDELMDSSLLYFLLADSDTAVNYWKREGRLEEGEGGFYLTPEGLKACDDSLNNRAAGGYNTSEAMVNQWTNRILSGDRIARRRLDAP